MDDIIFSMLILKENILSGRFKKKFTFNLMRSRYKYSKPLIAQFKDEEGDRYFQRMIDEGLFDAELISMLDVQDAESFRKEYVKLRPEERKKLRMIPIQSKIDWVAERIPKTAKDKIKTILHKQ